MSLQISGSYTDPRTNYAQQCPAGREKARGREKCTTDTDQVDREIKQLREKKRQLEQQLERAVGDEKRCRELEKQLAQINAELGRKDNDTYRRQHARTSE